MNHFQDDLNNWWMKKQMTCHFQSPIHILYLDDNDVRHLGGWPLPRNVYAFIAHRCRNFGAKVIGFHIYWEAKDGIPNENDLFLAETLQKNKNIVGSFYFDNLNQKELKEVTVDALRWYMSDDNQDIIPAAGMHPPDELFLNSPAQFGFANLPLAHNGMVTDTELLARYGKHVYPSFAFLLASSYRIKLVLFSKYKKKIHYNVDAAHLPLIPVNNILQSVISDSIGKKLEDAIVIVGIISSQLGFEKPAPVDPAMPVVGIHAQIVDNILANDFLVQVPEWIFIPFFIFLSTILIVFRKQPLTERILGLIILLLLLPVIMGLLWKINIIFQMYGYGFAIFCILCFTMIDAFLVQKERMHVEIEKRTFLQEILQERTSVAGIVEKYNLLKKKYDAEITDRQIEVEILQEKTLAGIHAQFPEIICHMDSPMIPILAQIERIGQTNEPVFIRGESGTGKEMIAQSIHHMSSRHNKPFIAINCGAIAETLLESEFFGYEKGAFTGADKAKIGFFEEAHGGTLFLDEITETSLAFQSKLLRVLQEGTYYRVGSSKTCTANVRIIAATNQDPQKLIQKEQFRQDLYFRLNVLPILLPPLRERRDDIQLLLNHFLQGHSIKFTSGAIRLLKTYHWPGNIRELQNLAARIKILTDGTLVSPGWLEKQLDLQNNTSSLADPVELKILELFRELKFTYHVNTRIADLVGNLHRSTVTEYLRGITYQFFCETNFQINETIRLFNPLPNSIMDGRIQKRIIQYLHYIIDQLEPNASNEKNIKKIRHHIRKLPKKYHAYVIHLTQSYLQGLWNL